MIILNVIFYSTCVYANEIVDIENEENFDDGIDELEPDVSIEPDVPIDYDYVLEIEEYVEVEQGTTVKEFLDLEKQRRIEKWYKDEYPSNKYEFKFLESYVETYKGTTYKEMMESRKKLKETDLVATNMICDIGVNIYSKETGEFVFGMGEGTYIGTVVKGDLTGTGNIEVTDISIMQEQILETIELKGAFEKAADMNSDETIDVIDLSEIQEYIVNN